MKRTVLDEIDLKILNLLQTNGRITLKDMAQQVCLTAPALAARIARLERKGIILGYHAAVNWDAVGLGTKAYINVEVFPAQKEEFYAFARDCRNIVECSSVTGEYAVLLEVVAESTMELDRIVGNLGRFGRSNTQVVFSTPVPRRAIELRHGEKEL